jgi:hypothetical protein
MTVTEGTADAMGNANDTAVDIVGNAVDTTREVTKNVVKEAAQNVFNPLTNRDNEDAQ